MNAQKSWEPSRGKNLVYALCIILLVLGWRLGVYAKAGHIHRIARELASAVKIVNHPIPNHVGDQLLYAQSTEKGVGVYLMNLVTVRKQKLFEVAESQVLSGSLSLLVWSPDDQFCAYAKPIKGSKQKIVLCNARDGTTNASPTALGYVQEFCWLTPSSFAYRNNSNHLHVVSRVGNGRWVKSGALTKLSRRAITHFTAISPTTLAWKQDGAIWKWSLLTNAPVKLWQPKTNDLVSFSYSPDNEKLIISARNKDNSYQIGSYHPATGAFEVLNQINLPEVESLNWEPRKRICF